ncbi:MAG: metal-dependent hydrolase [bacterium]|nr:metal-dependent hydrolase [bacterium]
MASLFAHGFVAASAGALPYFPRHRGWILLLGAFAAIVPDADVLAFRYGIPYADPFGHRGATHSIVFAVLLAALLTLLFYRSYPLRFPRSGASKESDASQAGRASRQGNGCILFCYFFLCTISHALLDAMTNGGLGVAIFFPFDNARYFLPDDWRVIQVSPIGARRFFSERGLQVIISELKFVALPWTIALAVAFVLKIIYAKIFRQ